MNIYVYSIIARKYKYTFSVGKEADPSGGDFSR